MIRRIMFCDVCHKQMTFIDSEGDCDDYGIKIHHSKTPLDNAFLRISANWKTDSGSSSVMIGEISTNLHACSWRCFEFLFKPIMDKAMGLRDKW